MESTQMIRSVCSCQNSTKIQSFKERFHSLKTSRKINITNTKESANFAVVNSTSANTSSISTNESTSSTTELVTRAVAASAIDKAIDNQTDFTTLSTSRSHYLNDQRE